MTYLIRRRGSKSKLLTKLQEHFPIKFNMFIDMFFGGGSVSYFVAKNYKNTKIIANDNDNEIANLYYQLKNNKEALLNELELIPYHNKILQDFRNNYPKTELMQAVRYVYLNSFSYLGSGETLRFDTNNSRQMILSKMQEFFKFINRIQFNNTDFREVIKNINISKSGYVIDTPFIYADPPYLGTSDSNYQSKKWSEQDALELLNILKNSSYNFMVSEFDNDFYKDYAKQNNLNYITIGERLNIKNRNTEIIVTNYNNTLKLF
jgi:DNA adenine methylase